MNSGINCNIILNAQSEISSTKFLTFELKQTQMNIKPIIAWTFVGFFAVLLLYFLLSKFADCSLPIAGMLGGLDCYKSNFCSFANAVKMLVYGGFIVGAVFTLINYFVFNDKDAH